MTIKALYPNSFPTLDLNFARAKRLDSRITFTRASTGTFVASDGLIKNAASGAARFDHNPVTGESLGLLVEEARTNYASQSLVAINATLISSSDTTYQPLQGGSVYKFSIGSSGMQFYVPLFNAPGYGSTGLVDTLTFYLRSDSPVTITSDYNGSPEASGIYFSNGTTAGYGYTVTQSASVLGFTRYTITYVSQSPNGNSISRAQINVSGTTGTNFYVFGAQWESRVSFPTSYIPTTSAAVTRAADTASITGTNFSSWYRQDEGTTVCNFRAVEGDNFENVFSYATGTASGQQTLYRNNSNTSIGYSAFGGGVAVTISGWLNTANKIAGAYKANSIGFGVNGGLSISSSTPTVTTSDTLRFGESFNQQAPNKYNGTIARLAYYPTRLPDAQLIALTQ